jgi:hypothetical protein
MTADMSDDRDLSTAVSYAQASRCALNASRSTRRARGDGFLVQLELYI